ncbi:MAG: hypothetical protein AAFY88_31670, partial [Acidobacteriota bacterium]
APSATNAAVALEEPASTSESMALEILSVTADRQRRARLQGYEGDSCPECGNFTLVRNGTCLKCDTCGGTTGCS